MSQRKLMSAVLIAAFGTIAGMAHAVPLTIEGKIVPSESENPSKIVCNGVTVDLSKVTAYTTPTATKLEKAQFFSSEPFPGRAGKLGLTDGTCIIEGNSEGTGAAMIMYADTVFGEPAENVLVGPVTKSGADKFEIMGVPITLLTSSKAHMLPAPSMVGPKGEKYEFTDLNDGTADPAGRIVAGNPTNQFGYEVILSTVPVGDESSAEGYMGTDGVFYAFAVETTGGLRLAELSTPTSGTPTDGPVTPAPLPAPTVQRGTLTASGNNSAKLEVRGGCVMGPTATGTAPNRTQQLRVMTDNTPVGGTTTWLNPSNFNQTAEPSGTTPVPAGSNVTCTEDAAAPGSGTYRYRQDNYTYNGTTRRVAPVKVKVGVPGQPAYGAETTLERVKF
jgi:hypothetical protein